MRKGILIGLLLLALVLAACGDDKKKTDQTTPTPAESSGFTPSGGISLETGGTPAPASTNSLPGCSDPDSTECPSPLVLDLDGTAMHSAVTIQYPSRYFDAAPGSGDLLIEITPNDRFKFQETANFQVYFADSVESALAGLTDPDTGSWSNATLNGTIGVSKDETQTPPVNTTIGAFALADGRVIVLKLVTTQKFGWDLWSKVYEGMLNTIVVAPVS